MRHEFQHEGRLISYLEVHPPAPRHAGLVLLLHAFPLAAEMWEPQLSEVPTGWRFVAPDFRGFGRSSPDRGSGIGDQGSGTEGGLDHLSIDDYARDALALLDHLHAPEAVVCGLSMGGYAAFALWRLAPGRVRGLVLADTRPDADDEAARATRRSMLDTVRRDGAPPVADAMVPRLLGATSRSTRPALVERVRQLASAQSPEGVAGAIVRLMTRPDSTRLLAEIERPTLIVAGEEDEVTGPDIAQQMHGQMARAELALIGHAGHLSNLEQPAAFSAALDRFLSERFIQP